MATVKKKKVKIVGEDVQKLELSDTAGVDVKWCSCCEKQFGMSSKVKHRITI